MKHLPPAMLGFREKDYILADHASDADRRSMFDDAEIPRHFFDVERYPEYFAGTLPYPRVELEKVYGSSTVQATGYLPYAVMETYDSLRRSMDRRDWRSGFLVVADLGHYVADLHDPFHVTVNYDGQLTKNNGIHWRYETEFIDRYHTFLYINPVEAKKIDDPVAYVFGRVGEVNSKVPAILRADNLALRAAHGRYSTTYYSHLWRETGELTISLFENATIMFADLVYTAWLSAGSPTVPSLMDNLESDAVEPEPQYLDQNYPNPFNPATRISYTLPIGTDVRVSVFNLFGQEVARLAEGFQNEGRHEYEFNARDLPGGVYFIRLQYGKHIEARKMILSK